MWASQSLFLKYSNPHTLVSLITYLWNKKFSLCNAYVQIKISLSISHIYFWFLIIDFGDLMDLKVAIISFWICLKCFRGKKEKEDMKIRDILPMSQCEHPGKLNLSQYNSCGLCYVYNVANYLKWVFINEFTWTSYTIYVICCAVCYVRLFLKPV